MTVSSQEAVISQPLSSGDRFSLQSAFSSSFYCSLCIPSQAQARHFGSVISDLRRRVPSNLQTVWHRHCLFCNGYKRGGMKATGKQPAGKLRLALRELQTRSIMALLLQRSVFSLNCAGAHHVYNKVNLTSSSSQILTEICRNKKKPMFENKPMAHH